MVWRRRGSPAHRTGRRRPLLGVERGVVVVFPSPGLLLLLLVLLMLLVVELLVRVAAQRDALVPVFVAVVVVIAEAGPRLIPRAAYCNY